MAWARSTDAEERAGIQKKHDDLRAAASHAHADLRARIRDGTLRGAALRRSFEEVPPLDRDHFVEEVLGVAYPPLEEKTLGPELVAYTPSGYDEIMHAFDVTGLGAGDRFLDIGSGAGKVVLLAVVLTGASGVGLECDAALVAIARAAAADLALPENVVRFDEGDARDAPLAEADVVFMYIPFTGSALAAVMQRLAASPRGARFLCAGTLDLVRHSRWIPRGDARSWLRVYERALS